MKVEVELVSVKLWGRIGSTRCRRGGEEGGGRRLRSYKSREVVAGLLMRLDTLTFGSDLQCSRTRTLRCGGVGFCSPLLQGLMSVVRLRQNPATKNFRQKKGPKFHGDFKVACSPFFPLTPIVYLASGSG